MGTHRYVGDAAGTVVSTGKKDEEDKLVPVGFGDFVTLSDADAKHPDNSAMIESGVLIPVNAKEVKSNE